MTTKEVFKQIVSEHKWYAPFMSAQAAFLFKRRFVNGELKDSTIKKWFAKFGYSQNEVTWRSIKTFQNHDPLKHKLPVQILEVTETETELNIIMKCKHEWVMPEDSFELPYCKHCYKGA